jgi:hypothetical protein
MNAAQLAAELSLGDLITAARKVLDDHDQARGYEPEPGEPRPYLDAVVALVRLAATNLAAAAQQAAPDFAELAQLLGTGPKHPRDMTREEWVKHFGDSRGWQQRNDPRGNDGDHPGFCSQPDCKGTLTWSSGDMATCSKCGDEWAAENVAQVIVVEGRPYTVEKARPEDSELVGYWLTGQRGAVLAAIRNVKRPHNLFLMNGSGSKSAPRTWLTDRNERLEVLG